MFEWGPKEALDQTLEGFETFIKTGTDLEGDILSFLKRLQSFGVLKISDIEVDLTRIFKRLADFMHSVRDAILRDTRWILSAVEGFMVPSGNQTSQYDQIKASRGFIELSGIMLDGIPVWLHNISLSIGDLTTGGWFSLPDTFVKSPYFKEYVGRINKARNTYEEARETIVDGLQGIMPKLVDVMNNPDSREFAADLISKLKRFIEDTNDRVKRCISEFSPGNQHLYNNRDMREKVKERLKFLKLLLQN